MQKSLDGGGNNAYKIIMCRVEERNIICKNKNEKETIFLIVKKVNSMKPKSQDRRGDRNASHYRSFICRFCQVFCGYDNVLVNGYVENKLTVIFIFESV